MFIAIISGRAIITIKILSKHFDKENISILMHKTLMSDMKKPSIILTDINFSCVRIFHHALYQENVSGSAKTLHVCTCQYFEKYHIRNIQFAASPLYWSHLFSTTVLRVGWEVAKAKTKKQDDTNSKNSEWL